MGTTYYFAGLDFGQQKIAEYTTDSGLPEDTEVIDLLLDFIKSEEPVPTAGEGEWRFGKHQYIDDERLIVGKLGKEYPNEPKSYNEDIGDFEQRESVDADVSFFAIFLDLEVIAFTRTLRVRQKNFIRAFETGYNAYHSYGPSLSVSLLENDLSLREVYEIADSVNELKFDLEPTNPEASEEMQAMDERFKEADAEEFKIELFSDFGINIRSKVVRATTEFVEKDYAEVVAKYLNRGRSEQYNSKSKNAITQVEEDTDELEDVENRASELRDQAVAVSEEPDDE